MEGDTGAVRYPTLYLLLIGLINPVALYILLPSPHYLYLYSYKVIPTFSQSKVERLRFGDSSSPSPKGPDWREM